MTNTQSSKLIKLAVWNANGIRNKINEVEIFLNNYNIDIIIITETKLQATDKIKIRNYSVHKYDRNDPVPGGGVAILIKKSIPYVKITINQNLSFEYACIKLNNDLSIIGIYNKPTNYYEINELLIINNLSNRVIIGGDFNSKHISWNCNSNNRNGNKLFNFLNYINTPTHINFPAKHTHYPSNNTNPTTIDFFLTKNIDTSRAVVHNELNSDHLPVTTTILDNYSEDNTKYITSYKNTNWKEFRKTLDGLITVNNKIDTTDILQQELQTFTTALTTAQKQHTKTIEINNSNHTDTPVDIITLIKNRNTIRRRHQRNFDPALKHQIEQLNQEINNRLKTHKNEKWNSLLKNCTVKDNTLWNIAKKFNKKRFSVPPLNNNGLEIYNNIEKAELLAQYFQGIHNNGAQDNTEQQNINNTINNLLEQNTEGDTNYITEMITNPKEISSITHKSKNKKASGEDRIDNILLKNLSKKAIIQLMYIINASFKLNYYPEQFKTALVVPIPKSNKPRNEISSYRPISLLSNISKIIEKIILKRFNNFLQTLNVKQDCQFGFKPKLSTTHQLARVCNDILINFNLDKVTTVTLLDLEKAFDKVWIQGLLFKLYQAGINTNFIKLMQSYLTNRKIKVLLNEQTSQEKIILAGVPQGSVLSPALFNFYLHDMPKFLKANLALYADDTAIYSHSFYAQAALVQNQIQINMLEKFFDRWKLKVNENKTELIVFHRKRTNQKLYKPLKINNHSIWPKESIKYLGLQLDQRLNFKQNVKISISKANGALRQLFPLLKRNSCLTTENKLMIYKALIRPIFTYAAPIWSHLSNYAFEPLEIFQNKCLRIIHNAPRYTRTQHLRDISKLPKIKDLTLKLARNFFSKNTNTLIKTPKQPTIYNIQHFKHKLIHSHLLHQQND